MIAPTTNPKTNGKHGAFNAVDYDDLPDPSIYAPEDGKITFRGADGDCGLKLWLQSDRYRHTFCHLKSFNVALGQQVKKGDVIGIIGKTGRVIAGPGGDGTHLHWVVKLGNTYIYPPTLVNESRVIISKGEAPMTPEQEAQAYQIVLGRNPEGAPSGRTGWQFIIGAKPELDAVRASNAKLVADLRVALENAKNKPAEKVVVEVEKIVEKVVEKQVVKEVEPDWLTITVNFLRKVLRIKE